MTKLRVRPGSRVRLKDWDPDGTGDGPDDKKQSEKEFKALRKRLIDLQQVLYAEHKRRILIVLQAMDTGGKDGTIRNVFQGVNPQGVKIVGFKAPTAIELDHDYLWRVHPHTPGRGEIVVFNRSHYEDVLVVRVHELVPEERWRLRYRQIVDFERMLTEEGTTILKFYLHIDKDEQKKRLQARLDDPTKNWKFNPRDLDERKLWPRYREAYEALLESTSTADAPWHIIPSNRKWCRNHAVASIIVEKLESLGMEYPKPMDGIESVKIDAE